MLLPPKQDDWSARMDPTKIKNRKFNTGKGSKAPAAGGAGADNTLWTETPEEKRQRLADEVLGVKKPAQLGPAEGDRRGKDVQAAETRRRVEEFNERNRGGSLYAEHKKGAAGPREKEDDPSGRAFDREKDVGLGVKVGHKQRREMVERGKGFGDRFEGGSFL